MRSVRLFILAHDLINKDGLKNDLNQSGSYSEKKIKFYLNLSWIEPKFSSLEWKPMKFNNIHKFSYRLKLPKRLN